MPILNFLGWYKCRNCGLEYPLHSETQQGFCDICIAESVGLKTKGYVKMAKGAMSVGPKEPSLEPLRAYPCKGCGRLKASRDPEFLCNVCAPKGRA